MNNITNKELDNVYTAIFLLERQLKQLKDDPSTFEPKGHDVSQWMLFNDLSDSIEGLKEVGKVLRSIRSTQLKGYHA
tara:strand:+ start:533 stop:763 length:231 start_codon:yes stop_codon:yes gene_type:complete